MNKKELFEALKKATWVYAMVSYCSDDICGIAITKAEVRRAFDTLDDNVEIKAIMVGETLTIG